jgi:hypothetical protein
VKIMCAMLSVRSFICDGAWLPSPILPLAGNVWGRKKYIKNLSYWDRKIVC